MHHGYRKRSDEGVIAPWDVPPSTASLTDNYIRLEEHVKTDTPDPTSFHIPHDRPRAACPSPANHPSGGRCQGDNKGIRKTVRMETTYSVNDDDEDVNPVYRAAVVVGRERDAG